MKFDVVRMVGFGLIYELIDSIRIAAEMEFEIDAFQKIVWR